MVAELLVSHESVRRSSNKVSAVRQYDLKCSRLLHRECAQFIGNACSKHAVCDLRTYIYKANHSPTHFKKCCHLSLGTKFAFLETYTYSISGLYSMSGLYSVGCYIRSAHRMTRHNPIKQKLTSTYFGGCGVDELPKIMWLPLTWSGMEDTVYFGEIWRQLGTQELK